MHHSFKWWSVRLAALWAGVVGVLIAAPETFLHIWAMLPDELRPDMPPWLRGALVGLLMFGSIWKARLHPQPGTETKP